MTEKPLKEKQNVYIYSLSLYILLTSAIMFFRDELNTSASSSRGLTDTKTESVQTPKNQRKPFASSSDNNENIMAG
jgi:hypothetical protein